ncbi:hypothetical protein ACSXAY_18790 (plasmid) [Clostridium perfringens]
MNYKYGLQTINPTFERIRRAIEGGKNYVILIAENRDVAQIYLKESNKVFEKLGYVERIEKIDLCYNRGDFSVISRNKEHALLILCGDWYRNDMFLTQGVLKEIRNVVSVILPDVPNKLFNPFTKKVEYIGKWSLEERK